MPAISVNDLHALAIRCSPAPSEPGNTRVPEARRFRNWRHACRIATASTFQGMRLVWPFLAITPLSDDFPKFLCFLRSLVHDGRDSGMLADTSGGRPDRCTAMARYAHTTVPLPNRHCRSRVNRLAPTPPLPAIVLR